MAKRLKQASLFETLAKKKCDLSLPGTSMECHSSDEEIAMESENYPLDSEVLVHSCQPPKKIFRDLKPHPLDHTLFLVTLSLY